MNKSLAGALCLSLAASIWGGMYVVSKYVLDFIPPITLVWLRYAVAFLFLYGILWWSRRNELNRKQLTSKDWLLLGWIGFIGYFVSISFQFIGTKYSDAHTGALITSATPAFMVLFGRLVLKESLTLRKTGAFLLSFAGVVTVHGWQAQSPGYQWGMLMLVGAAVTWALLSVYVRLASERMSSLTITTYAILFALLFTTPFAWREAAAQTVSFNSLTVLGVLYLGIVSTAGAFFLWNKGMELMEASVGSLFFFFQPVVGTLLGWLLLKEHLSASFFVGGALILLGVFIATWQPKQLQSNFLKEDL
ncbi:DMT family transporter [Effusibacillus lacus]|uniref:EamA family transporter n=1 Tax=Effusibacillus lacus TaxID=1348429 RepID=A0A292YMB9_9BACL|nr:DMT family transporter [Effusibacillus lacus]TCS72034.1 EamA domain-containing membrane protein RarD [Effusibacillus lacus]GAX90326.1 EamA family transporter [Effusibacillus lacus]